MSTACLWSSIWHDPNCLISIGMGWNHGRVYDMDGDYFDPLYYRTKGNPHPALQLFLSLYKNSNPFSWVIYWCPYDINRAWVAISMIESTTMGRNHPDVKFIEPSGRYPTFKHLYRIISVIWLWFILICCQEKSDYLQFFFFFRAFRYMISFSKLQWIFLPLSWSVVFLFHPIVKKVWTAFFFASQSTKHQAKPHSTSMKWGFPKVRDTKNHPTHPKIGYDQWENQWFGVPIFWDPQEAINWGKNSLPGASPESEPCGDWGGDYFPILGLKHGEIMDWNWKSGENKHQRWDKCEI